MDGEIGVESLPGVGSTFWFSLPFGKSAAPAKTARILPRGLRVLVVDDNATNRHILQLQLGNLLQRPAAVAGAAPALQALRAAAAVSDPFPLAIVDMQMPEADGISLARSIRADPALAALAATRVILLSSLGEPLAEDEMRALGIAKHIVKPVKQSRLQTMLETMAGAAIAAPSRTASPAVKSTAILLAEDNSVNRKVALLQLRNLGYEADVANDGAEVLATFEKASYDVVLMDCQMPVMDGYTATRKIRELYQHPLRIVAMTAHAMACDREKCLEAGMDDYLSKPVSPAELRRVLEAWQPAPAGNSAPPPADPPPVEMGRLLEITGHHPEMFRQIVRDYLEQADEIMTILVIAIERRDAVEVRRLAHKLGGSSASCGMAAIVPPLARLERMGEINQLTTAADTHYHASRQLDRIRRFLHRHGEPISN